jgi:GT2 family glycosyltransferase
LIKLSVIIVSWNVADLLTACLDSVYASVPDHDALEVIVVDSASSDGTPDVIRMHYPQVTLLPQNENLGFTRCNNIGLETARGRYLLLLNPDTEVIRDALQQMTTYLDAHSDVGIVGPHTLNTDGSHQSTRRRFPTRLTAFFESTWLQGFAPRGLLDRYYVTDQPDDGAFPVDWVQGSALMARREVYEQIGGLDTGYVMYYEELDWCKRARAASWQAAYLGTALITHHGGKSSEQTGARKHILYQNSKLRYFYKHHGAGFAAVLRLFLMATYLWQIALEGVKWLIDRQRPLRRQRVNTYWQVVRSGLRVR